METEGCPEHEHDQHRVRIRSFKWHFSPEFRRACRKTAARLRNTKGWSTQYISRIVRTAAFQLLRRWVLMGVHPPLSRQSVFENTLLDQVWDDHLDGHRQCPLRYRVPPTQTAFREYATIYGGWIMGEFYFSEYMDQH